MDDINVVIAVKTEEELKKHLEDKGLKYYPVLYKKLRL